MASEPRTERRLLGGAVLRLRQAYGLKQDQLADKAGITFPYLSKLERNKQNASAEVMGRIARALGVDLDDITYLTAVYEVREDVA